MFLIRKLQGSVSSAFCQVASIYLFVFVLVAAAFANAIEQPEVKAFFSTASPHVEDSLTYTVELSWEGEGDAWRIPTPRLTFEGFRLENVSQSSERAATQTIRRYVYHLTAIASGTGQVRSANIFCYPKGVEIAESLFLPQQEITIQKAILRPTSKLIGSKIFTFVLYGGIVLVGLVVLAIFTILVSKRKRKQSAVSSPGPGLEARYLQELTQIADSSESDKGRMLAGLTRLFQRYLSEKYNLSSNTTVDQLFNAFETKSDWSIKEKQWLRQLLAQSQEKQFSGSSVTSEDVRNTKEKIESFIQSKRVVIS